jgi:FdhD protein
MADSAESFDVIRYCKGDSPDEFHDIIGEEPLVIRIDGQAYATVMRTPGEETFHAAGFCLSEGIVEIRLTPESHKRAEKILEKKNLISLTSCGICGRALIEEKLGFLSPVSGNIRIKADDTIRQVQELHLMQDLHKRTRAAHAALLLDSGRSFLSLSEDVGRHNALDKAIGRLFMTGKLADAAICVLSSRISYEMVIKANRARIPVILGASRPTALAVKLGRDLNMTLACTAREDELIIFSGEERIDR